MTPNEYTDVFDIPMVEHDTVAKTIGEYLCSIVRELWAQGEGFSAKHPLGNSGWQYPVYASMIHAMAVAGRLDEYGDVEEVDYHSADAKIMQSITKRLASRNNGLTLDSYQRLASRTMDFSWTQQKQTNHALHGISAECGEIHSLYKKAMQGHEFKTDDLQEEIGDLLWFIAELATAYNLSLDEIAQHNIDKLRKRYPDGFDPERSVHRDEA